MTRPPSPYLDEDVRVLLAEVLRTRGYEALHALEVNRTGKSDEDQLVYAARRQMAILTHNVRDFAVLFKAYETQGKPHFGVIVFNQLPFHELLRRSLKLLSAATKDSLKNRLIWLSDYK